MVIFSHGVAAEDKGEEVRGGAIHKGIERIERKEEREKEEEERRGNEA